MKQSLNSVLWICTTFRVNAGFFLPSRFLSFLCSAQKSQCQTKIYLQRWEKGFSSSCFNLSISSIQACVGRCRKKMFVFRITCEPVRHFICVTLCFKLCVCLILGPFFALTNTFHCCVPLSINACCMQTFCVMCALITKHLSVKEFDFIFGECEFVVYGDLTVNWKHKNIC